MGKVLSTSSLWSSNATTLYTTVGFCVVEGCTNQTTDNWAVIILTMLWTCSLTAWLKFLHPLWLETLKWSFWTRWIVPCLFFFFECFNLSHIQLILILWGSREPSFGKLRHLVSKRFRSVGMVQGGCLECTLKRTILHKLWPNLSQQWFEEQVQKLGSKHFTSAVSYLPCQESLDGLLILYGFQSCQWARNQTQRLNLSVWPLK